MLKIQHGLFCICSFLSFIGHLQQATHKSFYEKSMTDKYLIFKLKGNSLLSFI